MTAHYQPETIRSLQKLWVALPVKAPSDGLTDPGERQRAILETYCEALSDCSSEAVAQTVRLLIAGKIEEASKNFCPKPPELACFVRAEQRKIAMANQERRLPAPEPVPQMDYEHRMKMLNLISIWKRAWAGDRQAQRELEPWGWKQ